MGVKYVKDFEFPSSHGFTGSASDSPSIPVRAHERRRFAAGGRVKKYAVGGAIKKAIKAHVDTPAPKGHKGLKNC